MQNKSKYIYFKCNKQKDIKLNNVKRRYEENKLTLIDRDNSYYLICHIESGKISVPQLINNKNEKEISDLKLLLKIVNEDLSLFNIKDFLGYAIDLYNIEMISKNKENCLVNKNKNRIATIIINDISKKEKNKLFLAESRKAKFKNLKKETKSIKLTQRINAAIREGNSGVFTETRKVENV